MPVVLAVRRLRLEDSELESSLGFIEKPFLKRNKLKNKKAKTKKKTLLIPCLLRKCNRNVVCVYLTNCIPFKGLFVNH
jgi:hypothetical protein